MTSRIETFSSVRMLANGSFWNGFGRVFSLIIAFVATPVLLHDTSHYSAPLDLVLRLIVVPIAISTAFFPAVATGYRTMPLRSAALLRIGSLTIMLAVWPVCVLIVAFPHQLLTLWLGADFASASRVVLLTLGLGAYLACVSVLPATFTDAIGRPDVGAKILLVQSVLYPSAIIFMIGWYGIEGAAVAWTVLCVLNVIVRLWACRSMVPQLAPVTPALAWTSALATFALVTYPLIGAPALRLAAIAVTAPVIMMLSSAALLERSEILQVALAVQRWTLRSVSVRAIERI